MYLGRVTSLGHVDQIAMIRGAGGQGGRAARMHGLGAYPFWPTGPWNGADVTAVPEHCTGNASVKGWKLAQQRLNAKLAAFHQPLLVVDGRFCNGKRSKDNHFSGATFNALSWWFGPGDWHGDSSQTYASRLATDGQPALGAAHHPDAVAAWQSALGVPIDGDLGLVTAAALDAHVTGWRTMTTDQITAALGPTQIPVDPGPHVVDYCSPDPCAADCPTRDAAACDAKPAAKGLSTAAKVVIAGAGLGVVGLIWLASRKKSRR